MLVYQRVITSNFLQRFLRINPNRKPTKTAATLARDTSIFGPFQPHQRPLEGGWQCPFSVATTGARQSYDAWARGKMGRCDEKILMAIKEVMFGWWFGTFLFFPYIWNNHPNWLIFFRGFQTTSQHVIPSTPSGAAIGDRVAAMVARPKVDGRPEILHRCWDDGSGASVGIIRNMWEMMVSRNQTWQWEILYKWMIN